MLSAAVLAALLSTPPPTPTASGRNGPGWELVGGETTLLLNRRLLYGLGVEVFMTPAARSEGGFYVTTLEHEDFPALRLSKAQSSFRGLASGALRHRGGLDLRWQGGGLELTDLELAPSTIGGVMDVVSPDGLRAFFLDSPHPRHLAESGEYLFLNMDLRISEALALRLGEPRWAGLAIGAAHVRTRVAEGQKEAQRAACVPTPGGFVDVELTAMSGVFAVDFDSERVALAPSVKLANVGTADVEWFQPIAPDETAGFSGVGPHPFLSMGLYRMADGAFQQIGLSDLKHAFFSANSDCACPPDQILFPGCTDTYGASTNWNRIHLGPRDELTAATGHWESLGSHFDGAPADDFRSHEGEGGAHHPDGFEHRLTARVEDLSTPGARYFADSWYVAAGDVNIFNSMGFREVEPFFAGIWLFPFAPGDTLTVGPAMNVWVDPSAPPAGGAATALDTGEGHVQLAAKTSTAPNGLTRFDYALMNLDFDRQIDSFSVPLPVGASVTNPSFHDPDDTSANDWSPTVSPAAITWELPGGETSALDWGTLYSFRFEANAGVADVTADLGAFEAGVPSALTVASKGPSASLTPVAELSVALTGSGSGEVTSAPVGIDCGGDCDELYAAGSQVLLSAAADPGSGFIRWKTAGVSRSAADELDTTLKSDLSLLAVFELCDRTLGGETVTGSALFEACEVLRTGAPFAVTGAGSAVLRAGATVVLTNGVEVESGGELTVEIDPSLLP